MRKTLLVYSLAAVYFIVAAHIFAARVSARDYQRTWTGIVTDARCGASCQVMKDGAPDLQCIQACAKGGSPYDLWHGNKVYFLEPQTEAAKFAARNVKVTGTISGNIIDATSIVPEPSPAAPKRQIL